MWDRPKKQFSLAKLMTSGVHGKRRPHIVGSRWLQKLSRFIRPWCPVASHVFEAKTMSSCLAHGAECERLGVALSWIARLTRLTVTACTAPRVFNSLVFSMY